MEIFDEVRSLEDPRTEIIDVLLASLDEAQQIAKLERESGDLRAELAEFRAVVMRLEGEKEMAARLARIRPLIEGLPGQVDKLVATSKVGEAKETVATLRAMLGDLGFAVKTTVTPRVTEFLNQTYIEEKRLQDDSNRHIINYVSLFARITGDHPLASYTRTHVVNYLRTLERLKTSVGKSRKDKDRSIDELLAASAGKPTMSATTIEKHVQHVKAFFKRAIRHIRFATTDEIEDMFNDIDLSDFVPGAKKRKRWDMDQLNALFRTPIWSGTSSAIDEFTKRHIPGQSVYRDAYWWLPVAALWTGARLEELAQLHREDLGHDRNMLPYIRIHNEGIRRVKTPNSVRNVPVHSELVRLGFLDLFVGDPSERIWPELTPSGRLKKLGDTYSTHFTDYRRHCGLYEHLRDFHSFRRTFITAMRTRAKVDVLTVAAMAGHDQDLPKSEVVQQTDDYTDYDIGPLDEELQKLDYRQYGLEVDLLVSSSQIAAERAATPNSSPRKRPRRNDGRAETG